MVHSLVSLALIVSSFAASSVSRDTSATWQADYGKALEATRKDDRPLLVVLDVPGNPQSELETEQLESKGEQAELLDAYQLCHVDVSTSYGKKVADAFHATEFPFTAIIDKTGSIVLCKKAGKISDAEWQETLEKYQAGEKSSATNHTAFYRGSGDKTSVVSPSYCPSCQLKAQQNN